MILSSQDVENLCRETFRELSIAKGCASVTQLVAKRNPAGASKVLEQTLLKAVSGCLCKVVEKTNS